MPNLLDEIRRAYDTRETGTLTLSQREDRIELLFHEGLMDAVASNIPRYQLGRFLSKAGFIEETRIGNLLEEARKRRMPLGEAAIANRLLDETELLNIVRDQAVQLVFHALANKFEVLSFTSGSTPVLLPARITLNQLLLELARKNLRPVKPQPHKLLVLSNGHDLSQFSWYPQELSVLNKLKFPRTIQELAVATGLEYTPLCRILSVLDNLKLVTSIDECPIETTTAVAIRGALPFESLVPEIHDTVLSDKLEVVRNESSFISEQFKTLKVRIGELSSVRPLKVITVSSADMQDGKTLISANLALSFARDPGRRVILVDADMRNPSIHKYFGTTLEPGLHGFLATDFLQPYCYMRRLGRLYMLTAGGTATNPVELLSGEKMLNLVAYLKREFDTIVIDAPPLTPISDAQILSGLSDGLVVVVRSGKTSYGNLDRAFRTLDRGRLLGIVLNDVRPRLFHTHYNYRYYQYKNRDLYPYGKPKSKVPPKTYLDQ